MLVYAAGIGIGYGLTFFASTILLLDYFGRGPNLELFSAVNLISTIGAVGSGLCRLYRRPQRQLRARLSGAWRC